MQQVAWQVLSKGLQLLLSACSTWLDVLKGIYPCIEVVQLRGYPKPITRKFSSPLLHSFSLSFLFSIYTITKSPETSPGWRYSPNLDGECTEGRPFLSTSSDTAFGLGADELFWQLCQTILQLLLSEKRQLVFNLSNAMGTSNKTVRKLLPGVRAHAGGGRMWLDLGNSMFLSSPCSGDLWKRQEAVCSPSLWNR